MFRKHVVLLYTLSCACGGFLGAYLAGVHMYDSIPLAITAGICGGVGGGTGGNVVGRRAQRKYVEDDLAKRESREIKRS